MSSEISKILNATTGSAYAHSKLSEETYYKELKIPEKDRDSARINIPKMVETLEEEPQSSNLAALLGYDQLKLYVNISKPSDLDLSLFSLSTAPSLQQTIADIKKAQTIGSQEVLKTQALDASLSMQVEQLSSRISVISLNRLSGLSESTAPQKKFSARLSLDRSKSYRLLNSLKPEFLKIQNLSLSHKTFTTNSVVLKGEDLKIYQKSLSQKITAQMNLVTTLLNVGVEKILIDQLDTREQMGKFVRE